MVVNGFTPKFLILLEVSDPSMSVLAEGLGGPKSYILNKRVNTLAPVGLEGRTHASQHAQE